MFPGNRPHAIRQIVPPLPSGVAILRQGTHVVDDAIALARFRRDGSPEAFRALVDRHAPMVYAVCRRGLGGDAALAEDAAQAVFVILARKAAAVRDASALGPWLFGGRPWPPSRHGGNGREP
jgi:hypothetical protein